MHVMSKENGALVMENNIVESVATLLDLCVLQPLDFVGVLYKLAVPSQL